MLTISCSSPSAVASVGTSQQQPDQQSGSARHAYALMVAQEKNAKDHEGDGGSSAATGSGGGTTTSGGGGTTNSGKPEPDGNNSGHCTPVTLAANPSSPQIVGATVTFTGTTTDCPNTTYEFWKKSPTGSWTVLQGWSSKATASWNTTGLAAGNYSFDVWAKKPGSDQGNDLHIAPVLVYSLQPHPAPAGPTICTSVTWNQPTPASPQSPGTKVTLSGIAGGCSTPQYEFWVQAPSSTTWTILQAWSPSSTAAWDTTGLATGTYLFDIWVKDAPITPSWEAHLSPNTTYTLQAGAPCSTVTWNAPTPAEPQAPGAQVTLGGVAGGCPNPEYQFWVQAPGSTTWTILQAYSASSKATWNTTGLATGTYLFDIWARQTGSTAQWEAHISPNPTDSLQMGPACTSATLSFSPASPSPSGTDINLTATSAGCPNPIYEFWVQAPGGAWQVLKGYSSNATALWVTTGLAPGTYLFDVWVKNSGNSPDWEAHISPNPTYTLT